MGTAGSASSRARRSTPSLRSTSTETGSCTECRVYGLEAEIDIQTAGLSLLIIKELTLLCFDSNFASTEGWPVLFLDVLLMALVTAVTVVGLQSVGLILIIAFLITPATAARFWTNQLRHMLWLAAIIGAVSGWLGASISALYPNFPAGDIIFIAASAISH